MKVTVGLKSLVSFLSLRLPVHMDPPTLTVTSCGRDLCVDLGPPLERLRESYNNINYQLQIKSNKKDGEQVLNTEDTGLSIFTITSKHSKTLSGLRVSLLLQGVAEDANQSHFL